MKTVKCQHCQSQLEIQDEWLGMQSRCPICDKDTLLLTTPSTQPAFAKRYLIIVGCGLFVIIAAIAFFALSGSGNSKQTADAAPEIKAAPQQIVPKTKTPFDIAREQGFKFNEENTGLLKAPENLTGAAVIPDGVEFIAPEAFKNSAITAITLPDSVTKIEYGAFKDCTQLAEIKFGSGLTSIGNEAFAGCKNLTALTIPDSVTEIGRNSFKACTNLTDLSIGNGIFVISSGAFRECSKLTAVVIPDNVTEIDSGAFWECTALSDVKFGNSLEVIGNSAFYSCTNLKKIVLPDSLKTIVKFAFWRCFRLDEVSLGKNIEYIGDSAFISCRFKTISIPAATKLGDNVMPSRCKVIKTEKRVIPASFKRAGIYLPVNSPASFERASRCPGISRCWGHTSTQHRQLTHSEGWCFWVCQR